jgi:hypothetical protein
MRTKKVYQEPNAWTNALSSYLNDVAGAKRMPTQSTIFKCLYCSTGFDDMIFFGRHITSLVNKKLSLLNCCGDCYRERYPHYVYEAKIKDYDDNHMTPTEREDHIVYFIQKRVADVLQKDRAFLGQFAGPTSFEIGNFCVQHWDCILRYWPTLLVYSDETLVNHLYERRSHGLSTIVIRPDVLDDVCTCIVSVIKDLLLSVSGQYILHEFEIFECFVWSNRHRKYAMEHPEFAALFEQDAEGRLMDTPSRMRYDDEMELHPLSSPSTSPAAKKKLKLHE